MREQIIDAETNLVWEVTLLVVVPLLLLTIFLAQSLLRGLASMYGIAVIYAIGAAAFLVYAIRRLLRAGTKLDRLRTGFDAELAVGQELDRLMLQGAHVFHDLPGENFNIDHVVISTAGIFAVETKGYTKEKEGGREAAKVIFDGTSLRFPTWTTTKPLEQAERQATWLSQWLSSATGESVSAGAVLALPGWFVELKGRGPVRVFNGRQLSTLLTSRGFKPLSSQDVTRVAHQVEQRCRTVVPKYADDKVRARR